MRRRQIQSAIILATLALILTASSALAHAGHEHSLMDRILDSTWIPLLGVAALAFVSLSLWRVRGKQGE